MDFIKKLFYPKYKSGGSDVITTKTWKPVSNTITPNKPPSTIDSNNYSTKNFPNDFLSGTNILSGRTLITQIRFSLGYGDWNKMGRIINFTFCDLADIGDVSKWITVTDIGDIGTYTLHDSGSTREISVPDTLTPNVALSGIEMLYLYNNTNYTRLTFSNIITGAVFKDWKSQNDWSGSKSSAITTSSTKFISNIKLGYHQCSYCGVAGPEEATEIELKPFIDLIKQNNTVPCCNETVDTNGPGGDFCYYKKLTTSTTCPSRGNPPSSGTTTGSPPLDRGSTTITSGETWFEKNQTLLIIISIVVGIACMLSSLLSIIVKIKNKKE